MNPANSQKLSHLHLECGRVELKDDRKERDEWSEDVCPEPQLNGFTAQIHVTATQRLLQEKVYKLGNKIQ